MLFCLILPCDLEYIDLPIWSPSSLLPCLALNSCDEDDCPHTNSDGRRGRVCDDSCADGVPYGTFGCGARDGAHGNYCRVCYFDQDLALANDSADERAIM